jgi:hypothetical protein
MTRSGHGDLLMIGGGIGGFLLLMILWYAMGWNDCRRYLRQEAIQQGVGEYVLDPKTGQSTWRWKVTAEVKP